MQKARRHPHEAGLRPLVSVRFQVLFHSVCSRFFSPFPHGTSSLSVSQEYLALPDGAGRFPQDFSGPAVLRILLGSNYRFVYRTITVYGATFQKLLLECYFITLQSYNPHAAVTSWFGLFPFRSPLLGESLLVFFSSGYLDVSVLRVGFPLLGISGLQRKGCPIRKSSDLTVICSSPKLIAAYHVLHRL